MLSVRHQSLPLLLQFQPFHFESVSVANGHETTQQKKQQQNNQNFKDREIISEIPEIDWSNFQSMCLCVVILCKLCGNVFCIKLKFLSPMLEGMQRWDLSGIMYLLDTRMVKVTVNSNISSLD